VAQRVTLRGDRSYFDGPRWIGRHTLLIAEVRRYGTSSVLEVDTRTGATHAVAAFPQDEKAEGFSLSPAGDLAAVIGRAPGKRLRVRFTEMDGTVRAQLRVHHRLGRFFRSFAWSADGRRFAFTLQRGILPTEIVVVDTATGRIIRRYAPGRLVVVYDRAFDRTGRQLAFFDLDLGCRVLDLRTGRVHLAYPDSGYIGPQWSPGARVVAFATGRTVHTLPGTWASGGLPDPITAFSFSADGGALLYGVSDYSIYSDTSPARLFRGGAAPGHGGRLRLVATLGHGFVQSVTPSPDSRRVAVVTGPEEGPPGDE
jgi:hypothetical protein